MFTHTVFKTSKNSLIETGKLLAKTTEASAHRKENGTNIIFISLSFRRLYKGLNGKTEGV